MATAILGLSIDVHAGGEDLAFPHHVYESAMVESATGVRPFARAWMNVGTVTYRGHKIAKSTGNLVFVKDLLEKWPPEAIRLILVDRDWRESWDFTEDDLEVSAARLERLWSKAAQSHEDEPSTQAALGALSEGLDVPRALAIAEEAGGATARLCAKLLGVL